MAKTIVLPPAKEIIEKFKSVGLVKEEDIKLFKEIAKKGGKKMDFRGYGLMFAEAINKAYKSNPEKTTMMFFVIDFTKTITDDEEFIQLVRQYIIESMK